jgi:peptidoglycan/LPS O-acetylase OafA/YrhL
VPGWCLLNDVVAAMLAALSAHAAAGTRANRIPLPMRVGDEEGASLFSGGNIYRRRLDNVGRTVADRETTAVGQTDRFMQASKDSIMFISQKIVATNGRSTGFDYIRIALATAVIAVHTIPVCYGWPAADAAWTWAGPWRPFAFVIIPSFFALSGFLVAGSLERVNNIPVFLTLRLVRIFPALCAEVLISAWLIGPLLTALPLGAYFSDPSFRAYMLNVFGDIHYQLAGVFSDNPVDTVNAQLWTIPYELKCYIVLTLLAVLTVTKRVHLLIWTAAVINLAALLWNWHNGMLTHWGRPTGSLLIVSFLWGVVLFLNREKIIYNAWLSISAALLTYFAILWSPAAVYVAPLPIAYLTIYLGLQNPRKIWLIAAGDYSYGMYLYGWPIQQTIADLFPGYRVWYINLPASLLVTWIFAWLSWTLIESKILGHKGHATRLVDAGCGRVRRLWRPRTGRSVRSEGVDPARLADQ